MVEGFLDRRQAPIPWRPSDGGPAAALAQLCRIGRGLLGRTLEPHLGVCSVSVSIFTVSVLTAEAAVSS